MTQDSLFESKTKSRLSAFVLAVCFLIASATNTPALPHEFHTSLMRMDYNSTGKSVEISIQMFSDDILLALQKIHDRKVDFEQSKDIDQLLLSYLKANLELTDSAGKVGEIRWVGKEVEVDLVWVHVEIPFSESLEGRSFKNSLLMETFPEQINYVICRFEAKKADLLFKAGSSKQEIRAAKSEASQ
jgi:hypothetical protein